MLKIETENNQAFTSMADKLAAIMEDEVDRLAKEVEKDYLNLLRSNSPVDADGDDPGKLRRSWNGDTKKLGSHGRMVEAENDSGYTPYVEYGHRILVHGQYRGWQRGHFFVKKSLNKIRRSLPKRYDAMAERIGRRLGG